MRNNNHHHPAIASLGRYWDALLQGQPADPDDLDPSLAETVRQLHERDDAPGADAAYAVQLLKNLEESMTTTSGNVRAPTALLPPSVGSATNAEAPLASARLPPPHRAISRLWGRPVTQFATAALVLFTLTVAYLAFGGPRSVGPSEPTMTLPAAFSPPASPPAGMNAEETLLEITLPEDALPDTIYSGQNHYTIPPGSRGTWDPTSFSSTCCTGVRLNYVLDGAYTMRGEGAMQLLRSGAERWEDVPAETEIALESGDALLSRMDDSFIAVNSSTVPVELLEGVLFDGEVGTDPIPHERSGRPAWTFNDQDIMTTQQPIPPEPVVLRLHRATLPQGGVLPRPPGTILQLAVSRDSGDIVTTENARNPSPFELRNLGGGPATIYILSLQTAGTASPQAAETSAP